MAVRVSFLLAVRVIIPLVWIRIVFHFAYTGPIAGQFWWFKHIDWISDELLLLFSNRLWLDRCFGDTR